MQLLTSFAPAALFATSSGRSLLRFALLIAFLPVGLCAPGPLVQKARGQKARGQEVQAQEDPRWPQLEREIREEGITDRKTLRRQLQQLPPQVRRQLRERRAFQGPRPRRQGFSAGQATQVAASDLTVLESQGRLYGSSWPRSDLNFVPGSEPIPAGDVNGDGADDWIYRRGSVADDRTADLSDRTAKTLLRFGGGNFSARYYDELYYRSLRPVGNFVGTGDADSSNADAVRTLTGGGFQLYPGTSQGYVEGAVRSESFPPPNASPVDLNGDGYDEIIQGAESAPSGEEAQITALFGGSGADALSRRTFTPPSDADRVNRFGYAAGDVDGDGTGEIVRLQGVTHPSFPNPDDSLSVDILSLAGPDSLARESVTVDFPDGIVAYSVDLSLADVDGSGLQELIVRSSLLPGPLVLSSDGGAYQAEPVSYYPGSRPVGDLNGDGRADFALRDTSDGTPYVAFGPSAVGDGLSFDVEVPSGPNSASVFLPSEPQGDLDGDGREELIVGYQTGTQFGPRLLDLPEGSSSFDATDFLFDSADYRAESSVQQTVNVGDWNGDGTDDVGVVLHDGRVEIHYGNPEQASSADLVIDGPPVGGQTDVNRISVATGDFTGNGDPNLAVAWESDARTVQIYEAGSGGTPIHTIGIDDLGIPADLPAFGSGGPYSVVANLGDINGDGTDDFGVTVPDTDSSVAQKAFLFFGGQSLSTQPDRTIDFSDQMSGSGFFGQVLRGIGDINGDGTDDFLVGATEAQFDGGPGFPDDPSGQGFRGALFVHYGDASAPAALDSTDQILAVPAVRQTARGPKFVDDFGQGLTVGDFNGDDTTDVAAKPDFEGIFGDETIGNLRVRVYHGGKRFDNVPDATLPVPGFLDRFSDSRLAETNFAALTAVPPASDGGPDRLMVETLFSGNALIYGPGPDTTSALEKQILLRGPDQSSGLGVGTTFIDLTQNESSAVGDFDGDGKADLILPQLRSADFRGAPAYAYELGRGQRPDLPPVASTSRPVDSTSGAVNFAGTGLSIVFSDSTSGSGEVTVERFDEPPSGASGIAESQVSAYRFVISAESGLSVGDSTEVRFDVSSLEGIGDPSRVTIYSREVPAAGSFQKITTRYDSTSGELVGLVSGFSEFAFASDTQPLPVELATFEASLVDGNVPGGKQAVRLTWRTASETRNAGFAVERKNGSGSATNSEWTKVGFVKSKAQGGTASEANRYQYTDDQLPFAADSLSYRLRQVDTDGSASYSEPVTIGRAVSEVRLLKTYPNPARTQATIQYAVPDRQKVTLRLYDVLGRRVRTVIRAKQEGRQEQTIDTSVLPSGVYFLRLRAGGQTRTQKLTVVR